MIVNLNCQLGSCRVNQEDGSPDTNIGDYIGRLSTEDMFIVNGIILYAGNLVHTKKKKKKNKLSTRAQCFLLFDCG